MIYIVATLIVSIFVMMYFEIRRRRGFVIRRRRKPVARQIPESDVPKRNDTVAVVEELLQNSSRFARRSETTYDDPRRSRARSWSSPVTTREVPQGNSPRLMALRQNLRLKVSYDEMKIDRLIGLEREKLPNAPLQTLMEAAIERWERDNR